jgi:endonuclease/exonuclease/phosphatase (EEP) superfamily protein YafD
MQARSSSNSIGVFGRFIVQPLWFLIRLGLIALVITTSLSLLARFHWLADLLSNLRVQQTLVLCSLGGLSLLVKQWRWVAIAGVCLLVHLPWFIPASFRKMDGLPSDKSLTITFVNVLTSNQRHGDVIAEVLRHKPDAFVVLELGSALAETIRQETQWDYPHRIEYPMDEGKFGIGLYSRHALTGSELFALNTEITSIETTIEVRGQVYRIIATHPLPPIGDQNFQLRNEHLNQLAKRIGVVNSRMTPTVLVGDLNVTPWSPFFRDLEEATQMRRASKQVNLVPTWYRFDAFPGGLVLDHALISQNLTCRKHIVGPEIGSDHRSVTVTIAKLDR